MSQKPLTEQERADLVAFLDGELTGEAARAMEARLSLEPRVRAEAESLRRTWDLLDFLPRPEPSPSFTEKTLSKILPVQPAPPPPLPASSLSRLWWPTLLGLGWAALVALSALLGYAGYQVAVPREPGEQELVRDLRLIENKRFYDLVEDMEFLRQLDDSDLFGDDASGS